MKKLGIDRSTDLYYSNSRSREVRPDQSIKLQSSADELREVMIFPRAATADDVREHLGPVLEEAGFRRGEYQGFTFVSKEVK